MTERNDRTEKVIELLMKYLDEDAFIELARISADMERRLAETPNPTMERVQQTIADFFRQRGEDDTFIRNWLLQAEQHCQSYGLPSEAIPAAMLADFGLFRYMEFLYAHGMSEEEIMDVFANAAEERYELRINGMVIPTKEPPKSSS
ncbi:MAG: hypothetical protein RMI34_13010 [Chloroherpetonaceae bacterium]|nr:hypothetical protein [Chloroherpetonaceae bacterium]MCS7210540.1 hypothetical protein [Chloroherpetonaceae bacterium]MDW8020977.1 hypothetical protein [Chloroherpetonaceae bacterium]MDW8467184.1 hypothetical protein [Chloroherpetonaceae bacterium]